jgi:hypothetical protein
MISDEPDEDADGLDDDKLLMAFLDGSQVVDLPTAAADAQDWPSRHHGKEVLVVDADILSWFKMNHQDWQRQIGCVLRAWIISRSGADTSRQVGCTPQDQEPADSSPVVTA